MMFKDVKFYGDMTIQEVADYRNLVRLGLITEQHNQRQTALDQAQQQLDHDTALCQVAGVLARLQALTAANGINNSRTSIQARRALVIARQAVQIALDELAVHPAVSIRRV